MSQQLVKKGANGRIEHVNPRSWIEAIKDKNTGQPLVEILQGFNMYFLPYNGNTSSTRCLVPTMLRKKGLWITYVKYDGNVYTEWYAADEIDDKSWGDSSNWRIGNNTLVGDITVSTDGYWVINGEKTTSKAQGERGIQPLLRIGVNNKLQVSYNLGQTYVDVTDNPVYTQYRMYNNKLQVSNDLGSSWSDVSDYIAAWFRWQATTGDTQANNVGRIQMSRDNGNTWTNMSNDFTNNLHIKKYIGVNESLPISGIAEGTIYAKGPYYAEDDTLNDNPIYRLWVYAWKDNTLAWQDNGEFQSIAAGVVQETGDSETQVMSQKAVTEKLFDIGSKVVKIDAETIYSIQGYLNSGGNVVNVDGYKCTDFLLIDKMCDIDIVGVDISSGAALLCFYDTNKRNISEGIVMGGSGVKIAKENIPAEAVYFRSSTSTSKINKNSYISYIRIETILTQYDLTNTHKNKEMIQRLVKSDLFSIKGAYINMTHLEQAISSYNATDYLAIDKSADIIINNIGGQSGSYAVNFYDKDKRPITDFDYNQYVMTSDVVTHYIPKEVIPQNAVYIRSCVQLEKLSEETYIINANISSIFGIKNDILHINSRLEKNEGDIKDLKGLEVLMTSEKSYDNSILTNKGYISIDGITSGNYSDIYHTDYIEVSNGSSIVANLGVNSQIAAITLFKDNQGTLESVSRVINGGDGNIVDLVEFSLETTSAEKYVRFSSSITKFGGITITKKGAFDSILNLSDLFDYSKVLTMPRQVVRSMVETASNGRCTAIYDDNGMPSIMRKIPITSIGALSKDLGDLNTPHPAFMVNGETKGCIYVSCFQTSIVNGVPVSWFGLVTDNGGTSYRQIKDKIHSKGEGWHLETIYERSLLSLLSVKHHNSTRPRGNTQYGRSHEEGFEYECVERVDGKLPGEETFAARWINGTQPLSWSHDNTNWGVFDLVGGHWEWCDLLKVVDGQIYIAEDNNYNSTESDWIATGAYIDVKSDSNIYFDTSRSRIEGSIIQKPWSSIVISDNYSKLPESLRKKLALLLVCPKVNATDEKPLFDFSGNLWIKTDSTYYPIIGGAEEYGGACGFGQIAVSYPETESHGNMGSRICYLPTK